MAAVRLTPKTRLIITICISLCFFIAEIVVAFLTKSLALMADAFHYLNDLVGFVVALTALIISERSDSPQDLSFGWQRASLLGAFFNGVFLLALGISIFLQAIERFISLQHIEEPKLVLIMGCIGLVLNIISAAFLHESRPMESIHTHAEHKHLLARIKNPGRDLGMLGVMIHVIGDAFNNIGVIIAAAVIWQTSYDGRFYADPAVSMGIAVMILLTALPLVKGSGTILLQSAPRGVDLNDVKHDLEKIPGIESVHELHIWRLDQKKSIASAHVVVSDQSVATFMDKARTINECLHAYGIHSLTLQPEIAVAPQAQATAAGDKRTSLASTTRNRRRIETAGCQMLCGSLCENLMCSTLFTTFSLVFLRTQDEEKCHHVWRSTR